MDEELIAIPISEYEHLKRCEKFLNRILEAQTITDQMQEIKQFHVIQ